MNVEQALNAADGGEAEGLRGLYPMAAQVLAAEVRELREKAVMLRDALENMEEGYNPETGWMVKCWDAARHALSETEHLRHNVELTGAEPVGEASGSAQG